VVFVFAYVMGTILPRRPGEVPLGPEAPGIQAPPDPPSHAARTSGSGARRTRLTPARVDRASPEGQRPKTQQPARRAVTIRRRPIRQSIIAQRAPDHGAKERSCIGDQIRDVNFRAEARSALESDPRSVAVDLDDGACSPKLFPDLSIPSTKIGIPKETRRVRRRSDIEVLCWVVGLQAKSRAAPQGPSAS